MSNDPSQNQIQSNTLFGHPTGLFTLFFAEMWERFSYYGMRALLVFYMLKGFLGYGDKEAYAVYGAYTALVYMTPFFGGMLADRLLGARRAVVLGGLLMAAGHLLMTVENTTAFFMALALLICGNGFFKPNISTIVGSLYPKGSPKRDGGFTIFYMGINLGAAMSPLLCGYIGETYGWHYGFGLATIGMLTGLAVFVMPTIVTQIFIMLGAMSAAGGLFFFQPDNPFSLIVNIFVGLSLLVAGVIAWIALGRGGLPQEAGAPSNPALLKKRFMGLIPNVWMAYIGTAISIPVFALMVSGFTPMTKDGEPYRIVSEEYIQSLETSQSSAVQIMAVVVAEISKPAGLLLMLSGLLAFGYILIETFRLHKVARERMFVVMILTFFSLLFWAFFEQAGSSVNNFTDRNVDRVTETSVLADSDVGKTLEFRLPPETDDEALMQLPLLSQEQLGHLNTNEGAIAQIERAIRSDEAKKEKLSAEEIDSQVQTVTGDGLFTLTALTYLRTAATRDGAADEDKRINWTVTADNIGMGIGGAEVPASIFQAANPGYIIIFGLVFTLLWGFLATRGLEPSTPVKFAFGLLQLGLGFGSFWYGAHIADDRGMVALVWLLLGYLFQTTGELCLSPVGLSMITKLSPARLISTVMGAWFLASAFALYLAAIIAQFTGGSHGEGGSDSALPIPLETVNGFGDVFGKIAISAFASALILFILSPILSRWMHPNEKADDE